MSEDIYAMPDLSKKVRFQTGEKADGNADVYEITDDVNIYDNYLQQGSTPLELQDSTTEEPQKAISVNVPSGGRNLLRPAAMFLLLLCLLFLAGVVVLVVLLIQDKGLIADLTRARDELQTSNGDMKSLNDNLTQKTDQLEKENSHLKAVESNLTTEIDELKQQQERSCSPYWIRFGNSCYFLSKSKKKWKESKSFCEDLSAQLVIISSEQEQIFTFSFHGIFWIGVTDEEEEGVWKWVNESVAMKTYWGEGQPDNYGDSENCATLGDFGSLESWNDIGCDTKNYALCEKILE
ncbi:CD209 antigen-like protein E [Limanda limanda]|uniref:CD209 antigen-like protein E n=1 Tax=Limanda limanda TaxID=27771 RepID=UPI0029C6FB79|nr:CD209 antigen-like protein E [Limanda limanda]